MKTRVDWKTVIVSAVAALIFGASGAYAIQTNYLGVVFVADATTPTNQLKVNSDGSLNAACH